MRLIKDNVERVTEDAARIEKLKAEGFKELNCGPDRKENIPAEEAVSLEKLSAADLRKLAKEKGVEGYSSLSKDELLAVLKDVV